MCACCCVQPHFQHTHSFTHTDTNQNVPSFTPVRSSLEVASAALLPGDANEEEDDDEDEEDDDDDEAKSSAHFELRSDQSPV